MGNTHWQTSLHVGGLVTLVAAVHYMYMREYWVQVHESPIVYRYVDWTITVPLQMIERAVQRRRFHQQDCLRAGLLVGCQVRNQVGVVQPVFSSFPHPG